MINTSLNEDRHRQTEETGEEVEQLMGADLSLYQESRHQVKGWYWAAVDRELPLSQVTLEWITAEPVDLYCQIPPPGENIPASV